ncbi:heme o synthase [Halorussus sp. MSC15.2]|uniref:heme o synthase n=1 Tax=Halorussus sp. MSC15.2 TaxID=2283638 RepID=UPI0013D4A839|nr:heme o synthase [Halorussus sp. MSC15.2]NEU56614.1 protoheme IX farnesyltransferase [Halorussus sp. MSC15.2]
MLAGTAIGVYLLVVVGATTALTDAAAACPTWPACHGRWLVPLDRPKLAVAWGHRVAALGVALALAATTALAWATDTEGRVRAALTTSAVLYPAQVGLGAFAATTATPALLSAVHLVVGMAIFGGIVVALAWTLEPETFDEPTGVEDPEEVPDAHEPSPAPTAARPDGLLARAKRTGFAYFRLMKPRLMWLLCLVASAAMALAAGSSSALQVETVVATLTGGVLSIGASGTFNHVLERDVDKKMNRTADRPAATDQIPVRNAVAFGVLLVALSLGAFLTVNVLAAALGMFAILFYSVIYTLLLKPNTVQNTVIGGFAGALPALIGGAAVTGRIGLPAVVLAGVIFLWTPAHFYNLALAYKDDYARGGFPMMPVVRGEAVTRKHILLYLGATLLAAGLLSAVTTLGLVYAGTSVAFGALFLWAVVRLHHERTEQAAFRSFHASNAYLGALLLAVVVDALVF